MPDACLTRPQCSLCRRDELEYESSIKSIVKERQESWQFRSPIHPSHTNVSGVFPHLALSAELGPAAHRVRHRRPLRLGRQAVGDDLRLHKSATGVGTGLYVIDDSLNIEKHPESRVGTYTNRYVHFPSNQLFFGPHVIDADGNVKTVEDLVEVRTCSTMQHLTDPDNKVYVLGMEGEFFEMDVHTPGGDPDRGPGRGTLSAPGAI